MTLPSHWWNLLTTLPRSQSDTPAAWVRRFKGMYQHDLHDAIQALNKADHPAAGVLAQTLHTIRAQTDVFDEAWSEQEQANSSNMMRMAGAKLHEAIIKAQTQIADDLRFSLSKRQDNYKAQAIF